MSYTKSKLAAFRKTVREHYRKNGRNHLPWRKSTDPYRVLVSEIMLQQTQVDRVIPYYRSFLKRFPTVHTLAKAPLSAVLRLWQGLGYNRRAKMLHAAARDIVKTHGGVFPKEHSTLLHLPGVGPYTASAVRVFAFNEADTMIETNIRAALIHHFFPRRQNVSDSELLQLTVTPHRIQPKEWYAALMDYGAHLKRTLPNPSRRSAHHARQKPFKGSNREVRGALLKFVSVRSRTKKELFSLPFTKARITRQLNVLVGEGLLSRSSGKILLG